MTIFFKRNNHGLANEYKFLCEEADEMIKKPEDFEVGLGWRKVESYKDPRSNFKGVLYEKNGQYAICFVGTDKWSYKDHGANLKMATTGESRQIKEAKTFANKMSAKYGLNSQNTVSIGHSEGGTEATVVGVENNFKTVTFNAYGISKKQLETNKDYTNLVTNYRDPHDPISKLHENIGTTYITPSTQNKFMKVTPFGFMQSHGLKNMGDCDNSIPLEQYKRQNPMFLNKISDKEITREEIGKMDSDLFKVYEKEIDSRVATNRIKSSSEGKWVTINSNHVLIKD